MTLTQPEINAIVTRARTDTIRRHAALLDWKEHIARAPHNQPLLTYDEYLASEHWQEARRFMLERANYKCEACQDTDSVLHVHHLTYERLGRELEEDLIVLCEMCHKVEHGLDI